MNAATQGRLARWRHGAKVAYWTLVSSMAILVAIGVFGWSWYHFEHRYGLLGLALGWFPAGFLALFAFVAVLVWPFTLPLLLLYWDRVLQYFS